MIEIDNMYYVVCTSAEVIYTKLNLFVTIGVDV